MSNFVYLVIGVDAHCSQVLGVYDDEDKAHKMKLTLGLDDDWAFISVCKHEVK